MRPRSIALVLFVTACSSSSESGGGNVSFGGAQDIGQFQSILDSGGIPGPDTLDANGFFNTHYTAPPPADCGEVLCLVPGLSVGHDWLTGAKQATLQLAVDTPIDPSTYTRPPLDLVVVIDHSGSMASDGRLDKVKAGLDTLVDNLIDGDRLAIVKFDDQVEVVTPFTDMLDRDALHAEVAALEPGGGTDIYDGLAQGFAIAQASAEATDTATRQHRVIFMSDGNATSGDTSTDDILQMSDYDIELGIQLTTVGVGTDFDVDLMKRLAEHGAGNFYYLESTDDATNVFTDELAYFVVPLADNIDIRTTAGDGFGLGAVTGAPAWTGSTQVGEIAIPAAFLARRTTDSDPNGDRRGGGSMIFVDVTPTGDNASGVVAYTAMQFNAQGDLDDKISETGELAYPTTNDDPYLSSSDMAPRFAMYNIFLGLQAATNMDSPDCATAALLATQTNAQSWNATHEDPDVAADLELISEYLGNLQAAGATATTSENLADCIANNPETTGNGSGSDTYYGGGYDGACSAGRNGAGTGLVIVIAGLLVSRRRRR